jgi:putative ATPase
VSLAAGTVLAMPRSSRAGAAAGDTLFAAAAEERLARQAPLAARLRPQRLDDVVGQDHLVGEGRPLRVLVESDRLSSAILWGPPGTGKTTLAQVVARHTAKAFEQLSAVSASVKDVREVLARAEQRLGERDQGTILFLDEVHRFNKAQQDALLPSVESGLLVLIGATTENPYFEVNAPLMSRATLFRLEPLGEESLAELVRRGLDLEGATAEPEAAALLVDRAGGDGRQVLTSLEVAVALAAARQEEADDHDDHDGQEGGDVVVTVADVEAALNVSLQRYGRDDHYDVISAFIKSIRGSDPQASLYWLARMLEAGEDPRFVARRLVILASEDVGEADPMALMVATAAAHALELVGLPEAQLNLAQAVVHLATAPKSNRSALGIWRARGAVQEGGSIEVPSHLRDSHYWSAQKLGHGAGYEYPHDDPRGWVPQQYLPDDMRDAVFYTPSRHGFEQEISTRMESTRSARVSPNDHDQQRPDTDSPEPSELSEPEESGAR